MGGCEFELEFELELEFEFKKIGHTTDKVRE